VTGDGYQAGYCWKPTRGFGWLTLGFRLLKRFRESLPWFENDSPRVYVTLPQPIFRYRALFPSNYRQKVKTRRAMASREDLRRMWDDEWVAVSKAVAESGLDPSAFWRRSVISALKPLKQLISWALSFTLTRVKFRFSQLSDIWRYCLCL